MLRTFTQVNHRAVCYLPPYSSSTIVAHVPSEIVVIGRVVECRAELRPLQRWARARLSLVSQMRQNNRNEIWPERAMGATKAEMMFKLSIMAALKQADGRYHCSRGTADAVADERADLPASKFGTGVFIQLLSFSSHAHCTPTRCFFIADATLLW